MNHNPSSPVGLGIMYLLRRPDNTFLLQLRDDKAPRFPNTWCFPGGGCDTGEDFETTLIREIKEETALDVPLAACRLLVSRYNDEQKIYVCDVAADVTPQVLEGADMQWKTLDEIKQLDLGFDQGEVLPRLGELYPD